MSAEIDGIKALLDAHLTNLRSELQRLATNYDQINATVQEIQRNTNVAIAEIRKDITSLQNENRTHSEEIKAIKQRIEINEDIQQEDRIKQKERNDRADKKSSTIANLLIGAIGTFITLAIATLWKTFFP
jgi:chromosome segregation ATPase